MVDVITNAYELSTFFREVAARLSTHNSEMLLEGARALQLNVQNRIKEGVGWQGPSKWLRAKKNANKALEGAERFVKMRVFSNRAEVYGQTDGEWTLTEHHEGFANKIEGVKDRRDGERIVIDIVNPSALRLKRSGEFSWKPRHAGETPPRKIWPDAAEVSALTTPIASRWLRKVINSTPGVVVRQ